MKRNLRLGSGRLDQMNLGFDSAVRLKMNVFGTNAIDRADASACLAASGSIVPSDCAKLTAHRLALDQVHGRRSDEACNEQVGRTIVQLER